MDACGSIGRFGALAVMTFALLTGGAQGAEPLKALIVDGQNNHDWKGTTPILKAILEGCGRFSVDVSTSPPKPAPSPDAWNAWRPEFAKYAVVVLNYNGEDWPEAVRTSFVDYVRNGGGLVIVHAADNSFGGWAEFNEMIGVGGWGGRNEKSGPMVRWRDGAIVQDATPGSGGTHGAQHEFVVETRAADHPVMKGLPAKWKHAADELYGKLRGPAKNLTVLATAYSAPETNGTGEHEPILMAIDYGKGRVFHTALGHSGASMSGVGFQVTTQRGAEWAATGAVTLPPPKPEELPADRAATRTVPSKR
jgi:uncharacterized protein